MDCVCDPPARVTTARPSAISFASKPIRRAMGTSFVFAFAMNLIERRLPSVAATSATECLRNHIAQHKQKRTNLRYI